MPAFFMPDQCGWINAAGSMQTIQYKRLSADGTEIIVQAESVLWLLLDAS